MVHRCADAPYDFRPSGCRLGGMDDWYKTGDLSHLSRGGDTIEQSTWVTAMPTPTLYDQDFYAWTQHQGTRKEIRYPSPSFLSVHCFANAPYGDPVSGTSFRRTSLSCNFCRSGILPDPGQPGWLFHVIEFAILRPVIASIERCVPQIEIAALYENIDIDA